MKRVVMLFLICLGLVNFANADETRQQNLLIAGFVDVNQDGINDLFRDANGDGVNDITGLPYLHAFVFVDLNQDGINDVFVDSDGNGVNDLDARIVDQDRDGLCDNIVDVNGDGINDISGMAYDITRLQYGIHVGLFWMGNGVSDIEKNTSFSRRGQMDYFIDEDGDGICDGRIVRGRVYDDASNSRGRDGGYLRGGQKRKGANRSGH